MGEKSILFLVLMVLTLLRYHSLKIRTDSRRLAVLWNPMGTYKWEKQMKVLAPNNFIVSKNSVFSCDATEESIIFLTTQFFLFIFVLYRFFKLAGPGVPWRLTAVLPALGGQSFPTFCLFLGTCSVGWHWPILDSLLNVVVNVNG